MYITNVKRYVRLCYTNTAVRLRTFSRIDPYRRAVEPEQRHAHIPPTDAPGPAVINYNTISCSISTSVVWWR